MYKTLQRFLLILFALLQCMSPLAHAHVDGIDVDHTVYSHDLAHEEISAEAQVETDMGAVIAMPHAYPAASTPIVSDLQLGLLNSWSLSVTPTPVLQITSCCLSITQYSTPHLIPWSQAPPTRN